MRGYYQNAHDVVCDELPELPSGPDVPVVKLADLNAPGELLNYNGPLATWDNFSEEVKTWTNSDNMQACFRNCARDSAFLDHKKLAELNPDYWTRYLSLSSSFNMNVLGAVICASVAMNAVMNSANNEDGVGRPPVDRTFGEEEEEGDPRMYIKDVVTSEIRTAGQLVVTPHLAKMAQKSEGSKEESADLATEFRGTLGHVLKYMVEKHTKYGFISNYDDTIFLKVDTDSEQQACVYYSRPINRSEKMDTTTMNDATSITTRMALLYIVEKCLAPGSDEWCMSTPLEKMIEENLNTA